MTPTPQFLLVAEQSRYALFAGDFYYPEGGWLDFVGTFPSIEAALAAARNADWFHVVDLTTMQIVGRESVNPQDDRER